MKLLKCIGKAILFLLRIILSLAGLTMNILLSFFAVLASVYVKS